MGTKITIEDCCYFWNTTVTDLDISGNRIMYIDTNALILVPPSLTHVRIDFNKFTFGPYTLQVGCVRNVKTAFASFLNSAFNPMYYIVEHGKYFLEPTPDTTKIACPYCNATLLKQIAHLTSSCQYIEPDLKNIQLQARIPQSLENLTLNDCYLSYHLDFQFDSNTNSVRFINISGNVFESFTALFANLSMLEMLDISRCSISFIGPEALKYQSLKSLILAHTYLGSQLACPDKANMFSTLPSLQYLDLSWNAITKLLTSTFSSLVSLKRLDVSNNNIEVLAININALSNLFFLDLAVNSIHSLPTDMQHHLESNENYNSNIRSGHAK